MNLRNKKVERVLRCEFGNGLYVAFDFLDGELSLRLLPCSLLRQVRWATGSTLGQLEADLRKAVARLLRREFPHAEVGDLRFDGKAFRVDVTL